MLCYDSSRRISFLCRMKLSRELLPILSLFCQMLLMLLRCTTVSNGFMNPAFSWIPCSVSDGMSDSNTINNHHSPVLLIRCNRSYICLLYIRERRKISSIKSISIILFIISLLKKAVLVSPCRACSPRVIDWSRIKSHSSIIQSFILSNTITWQWLNVL